MNNETYNGQRNLAVPLYQTPLLELSLHSAALHSLERANNIKVCDAIGYFIDAIHVFRKHFFISCQMRIFEFLHLPSLGTTGDLEVPLPTDSALHLFN